MTQYDILKKIPFTYMTIYIHCKVLFSCKYCFRSFKAKIVNFLTQNVFLLFELI